MEVYNDEALWRFSKMGMSESDVAAMYSKNPKTGKNHIAEFIDRSENSLDDWLDFAVNLSYADPYLALPIFEELYWRGKGDEANIGEWYKTVEQYATACDWFEKGMNNSKGEMYLINAMGYLDCAKMEGCYQKIPAIILQLLTYEDDGEIWMQISDIYKRGYGVEARSDIALGCLLQAKKCFKCDDDSELGRELGFIKDLESKLYERSKHLDLRKEIRKSLRPTNTKTHGTTSSITLQVGDTLSPTKCQAQLVSMGYELVKQVYQFGQIARRGSILDIYPFQGKHPYKIDWFGDNIDSIRTFDAKEMNTLAKYNSVTIPAKMETPAKSASSRVAARSKSSRQVQPKQADSAFSERYYRIIIYILVAALLFVCSRLYVLGGVVE